MKITKIKNRDIHQIKTLWEELNRHHWKNSTHFKKHFKSFSFENRVKQLESRDSAGIFVAEEKSGLIGYCIASLKEQTGEIDSIFVSPAHRNREIGEMLIEKAESWLREKGASKLIVNVAEGNESVFGFYNKKGYLKRFTVLEKRKHI